VFSVIFEVQPRAEQRDAYRDSAQMMRLELQDAPGFVDSVRYASLAREGWFLSLSTWDGEKASIEGRPEPLDQRAAAALSAYHLRDGQIIYDTSLENGAKRVEQPTQGADGSNGTAITLIDARQIPEWVSSRNPQEIATFLGFDHNSFGDCISWDVFEAVESPGDIILFVVWKDRASAMEFAQSTIVPDDARVRVVQIIRDTARG
jgi:quinol monooxygenase YgiN